MDLAREVAVVVRSLASLWEGALLRQGARRWVDRGGVLVPDLDRVSVRVASEEVWLARNELAAVLDGAARDLDRAHGIATARAM
jgi:hypothetical protein